MRRRSHRALLFAAALSGFAAFAAPACVAVPQDAPAAGLVSGGSEPGLHDCGTRVQDGYGTGWCSGTGSFRLRLTCSDNTIHDSARATLRNAYSQMSVACSNADATAVRADIVSA